MSDGEEYWEPPYAGPYSGDQYSAQYSGGGMLQGYYNGMKESKASRKRKNRKAASGQHPLETFPPGWEKQAINIYYSREGMPPANYEVFPDPGNPSAYQAILTLPNGVTVAGSARNRKDAERECAVQALSELGVAPGSLVGSGKVGQVGNEKKKKQIAEGAFAAEGGPPPPGEGYAAAPAVGPVGKKYNADQGFWVENRPSAAFTELFAGLQTELVGESEHWVFCHDELMWEFPSKLGGDSEGIKGTLAGHVRDMCLWDNDMYGKATQYGLKCGLREGEGSCTGVAFKVSPDDLAKALEIAAPTTGVIPAVRKAELTEHGEVNVVCFLVNQESHQFAQLSAEDKGNVVAGAIGKLGPNIQMVHLLEHELRMQGVVDEPVSQVCTAATRFLWPATK
eukprot:Hpha_TRINITY_DN8693_c0_g1::TRINITY_DN8693_c0_g1_i2::g.168630::m.168630